MMINFKSIHCSSSSFSNENKSPSLTKISDAIKPEINESLTENQMEVFHDDTSKLTFKEKMILFNKKKNNGLNTSSTLKTNRNRLTQVFYLQPHIYIFILLNI